MGTIEKQVAITLVSLLVFGAIAVVYTLVEPDLRLVRAEQMTEHSAQQGAALYASSGCVQCHLDNGYGTLQGGAGWPLNTTQNQRGSESALAARRELLIRTIARGRGAVMPAHLRSEGGPLNSEQIENIVDYIQHGHWPAPPVEGEAAQLVQGGGAAAGAGAGGGSTGAQLFTSKGCSGCHQIGGQGGAVGPNLSTIGTEAANRKPGMDAEAYIRESISNPNAFAAPGYQAGVMPQMPLTPEELDALVKYLAEQK